jgi:hypothetical protein
MQWPWRKRPETSCTAHPAQAVFGAAFEQPLQQYAQNASPPAPAAASRAGFGGRAGGLGLRRAEVALGGDSSGQKVVPQPRLCRLHLSHPRLCPPDHRVQSIKNFGDIPRHRHLGGINGSLWASQGLVVALVIKPLRPCKRDDRPPPLRQATPSGGKLPWGFPPSLCAPVTTAFPKPNRRTSRRQTTPDLPPKSAP